MGKLLKLVNTIAVITVASIVAVSVYTHGPQDRAYFAPNESYITPMSYVFYMWIPVVLLLALMAAYQWTTDKLETTVGYHFTMATIFYAMWFAFSITDHPILALFGVAFASGAMSFIYNRLKTDETLDELKDVFCVLLPFSVCHGWFPVLFFLNLHAVISPVSEEGPSVIQVVFALIVMILLFLSMIVGFMERKRGDRVGAFVIIFYLFGVFEKQQEPTIHWAALGVAIATTFYIVYPLICHCNRYRAGDSDSPDATTALLGASAA